MKKSKKNSLAAAGMILVLLLAGVIFFFTYYQVDEVQVMEGEGYCRLYSLSGQLHLL